MPTRAVLFDFDGVIAATENVHVVAWQRTFGVMGWDEPDESCAEAAEVDDRVFAARVFARRKIEGADVEGWVRRKRDLAEALLGDSPRIYPGLAALVRHLGPRARLAIVSTSWRGHIEAVLRPAGLLEAFELVIAKEDVAAPKPDPEGYLLALARLGIDAGDAVAIEDSPAGLLAARGAGIRAVAVGHRRSGREWAGPASFLPDLTDREAATAALLGAAGPPGLATGASRQ